MESHVVLRRAFKKVGCKKVASELGLSVSLIHQWSRVRDGKSEALNPLDRVAQLVALTKDERLLDWLCRQAGGRFVRQAEMPPLVRGWVEQITAEWKALLSAGDGSWELGLKTICHLPTAGQREIGRCPVPVSVERRAGRRI